MTLSSTVSQGSRRESWNSTERFSGTSILPLPSTPSSSPASARSSVLLPDPLLPMSATNSPAAMSSETSSSTRGRRTARQPVHADCVTRRGCGRRVRVRGRHDPSTLR